MEDFLASVLASADGRKSQREYDETNALLSSDPRAKEFRELVSEIEELTALYGRFPEKNDSKAAQVVLAQLVGYRMSCWELQGFYMDMRIPGWRGDRVTAAWNQDALRLVDFFATEHRLPLYGMVGEGPYARWCWEQARLQTADGLFKHQVFFLDNTLPGWQKAYPPTGADGQFLEDVAALASFFDREKREPSADGSAEEARLATFLNECAKLPLTREQKLCVLRANPHWHSNPVRGSQRVNADMVQKLLDYVRVRGHFPRPSPSQDEGKLFRWFQDFKQKAQAGEAFFLLVLRLDLVLPDWRGE